MLLLSGSYYCFVNHQLLPSNNIYQPSAASQPILPENDGIEDEVYLACIHKGSPSAAREDIISVDCVQMKSFNSSHKNEVTRKKLKQVITHITHEIKSIQC